MPSHNRWPLFNLMTLFNNLCNRCRAFPNSQYGKGKHIIANSWKALCIRCLRFEWMSRFGAVDFSTIRNNFIVWHFEIRVTVVLFFPSSSACWTFVEFYGSSGRRLHFDQVVWSVVCKRVEQTLKNGRMTLCEKWCG